MSNKAIESDLELLVAKKKDLETTIRLVQHYHQAEDIKSSYASVQNTIYPLLKKDNDFGRLLLIVFKGKIIGYTALCFGYSIELGGQDAFIDEIFIEKEYRGKKIGQLVIQMSITIAKKMGIKAVNLESRVDSKKLTKLYEACGFKVRSKYQIMTQKINN